MSDAIRIFVRIPPILGGDGDGGHVDLHISRAQREHMSEFEPRRSSGEEAPILRRDPDDEDRYRAVYRSAREGGCDEPDGTAPVGVQELYRTLSPLPRERRLLRLVLVRIRFRKAMQQGTLPTCAQHHAREEGLF